MSDKREFFESLPYAITYADATMEPRSSPYRVEEIETASQLTDRIRLPLPVISAAMDSVTESEMAIAMAEKGGLGVIHGAFDTINDQRREVRRVKKRMSGKIEKPITYFEDQTIQEVLDDSKKHEYDFKTFPVINREGNFSGLLTGTHFLFPGNREKTVSDVMTPKESVFVTNGNIRTKSAAKIMESQGITTLPILGRTGRVTGLWLYSDVKRVLYESGEFNLDEKGRLRVAAAVPTDETALARIDAMRNYLDVVVIDSAQGDTEQYAYRTLTSIKQEFPDVPVIIGNVTNPNSAIDLVNLGADAIKVGQGPGAICTTRDQTGIGYPQLSAIWRCAQAVKDFGASTTIIADGGVKRYGDISKALAAGAGAVMLGSLLAGTDQAPGPTITLPDGKKARVYRGMGSKSAMENSETAKRRYIGKGRAPLTEGVESYIPEKGDVEEVLDNIKQALTRSFMYLGVKDVPQHQEETNFVLLSQGAVAESGAHIASSSYKVV